MRNRTYRAVFFSRMPSSVRRGARLLVNSPRRVVGLTLAAGLFLTAAPARSAGPPAPLTSRLLAAASPVFRTNTPPSRPGALINVAAGRTATNVAAAKSTGTNAVPAKLLGKFRDFQSSRYFLPSVVGGAVILLALLAWRVLGRKGDRTPAKVATTPAPVSRAVPVKAAAVHGCNVLDIGAEAWQVWHFDVRGKRLAFSRENTVMEGESLPAMVRKDWRTLFSPKLNVAWLPPEQVFLRAAQFPRSDFSETVAMVELQLEKLSPMPVAQIVWSIQVLPHAEGDLQTVVVMIVSRAAVEEFLGKLEGHGYLADRLELPLLDLLQTTAITEDGAWIYPEAGASKNSALVAWWYGGVLRNLDLLTLTANDHSGSLKEQLMQMAWAGELEGWLTSPPDWHLVADSMVAAQWEPVLRAGLEQPIDIVTPLAARELAAVTARRAATADPRTNLLPPEYATRYHQQFVDRLWMRALLAVAGCYVVYVAYEMSRLAYSTYRTNQVETQVAQMSPNYTNAMQLKARYQVLKDRQELKYAALDCWNATAQNLPETATLDSLTFSQGKRLSLNGSAPSDGYADMNEFAAAMGKVTINNQSLFETIRGLDNWRVQADKATWSVSAELKRAEVQ